MLADTVLWIITAFAPGCGASGPTRAGTTPVSGHVVAADPAVLPLGSIVHIEGLGLRQVQDTGSGVRGRHLDVFMDTCTEAREWGRQRRRVRVEHKAAREQAQSGRRRQSRQE